MRTTAPVAILGAGLAGLTAAQVLRRNGVPVILYEAGKQVAGLAQSFRDSDGFTYDFGAHFVTNRLAAALGVGESCRDVHHYGESVLYAGKFHSYPFGLLKVPGFVRSALAERLLPGRASRAPVSAEEWFRRAYGRALADEVALPLLEAWSGVPASELAASVGDKLHQGVTTTFYLKLASMLTGRAVASGYSYEMPENPNVWHVYPEGGLGVLTASLAAGLKDAIQLESPVEQILAENERVVAVRSRGREQAVSAVVSTAPCNILAKLVTGTSAVEHLARFRYRPMVFVNLKFEGRGLLPDTVLWTPDRSLPFLRLTETPLSMPWLAPEGKTIITADIGCETGDEIWKMPDDALGSMCVEHMKGIVPDAARRFTGCRVLRTAIAYPIFLRAYEQDRKRLQRSTGVQGLYSIGRNGEFAHILMEDVYWRTQRRMQELLRELQN